MKIGQIKANLYGSGIFWVSFRLFGSTHKLLIFTLFANYFMWLIFIDCW